MSGNLKSYTKGKSGNPAGRPKGAVSLKSTLAKYMRAKAPKAALDEYKELLGEKLKTARIGDLIALALIRSSIGGETAAIKILIEQFDGKPVQPVDVDAKIGPNQEALQAIRDIIASKGVQLPG